MTSPSFLDELTEPTDEPDADAVAERGVASEAPPGSFILDPSTPGLLTKGILKRRKVPICGYVGLNGHGKSMTMIRDTLPSLVEGRPIMSTVALLDPHTGNPHPLYRRLESWQQLLDFRNGDLLLDEVTGLMDARDQGMPKHIRRHISQFRRAKVKVRWTGIDWDNTDMRMRQITQAVVRCRGHMPSLRGEEVHMWAPNRLFVLTTFDAQTLKKSTDSAAITEERTKQRRAKVLHREILWGINPFTGATTPAFKCYDTMDAVSWVDNSCPQCGGKPSERYCKGHDDDGLPLRARSRR